MEAAGYLSAIVIGISLGLIGGGGSILTVPILVYFFSISPQLATTYSLFIVGIASLTGSYRHYRLGNLKLKPALAFGIPSIVSILLIRKVILPLIPEHIFYIGDTDITKSALLMIVFAMLMIAASVAMIKKQSNRNALPETTTLKLMITGFTVGIVTGFLGAGGGFLIIPALLFFAALTMKQAIGTSLLIIAVNSLAGFAGDMLSGIAINVRLVSYISVLALAGIFIGTYLSKKVNGEQLKPAFGWFILLMGIYIIAKELFIA